MMLRRASARLLIVEDSPLDFAWLQETLQDLYSIKGVYDFDKYEVRRRLPEVDVALVDMYDDRTHEPKGLEIIGEIVEYGRKRRVPTIVMSSRGRLDRDTLAKAMQGGGARDFVWKDDEHAPSKDEFALKIDAALELAAAEGFARSRRRWLFRTFQSLVVVLAVVSVVLILKGSERGTLSLETLLIVLTIASLPLSERYL